MDGDFLSQLSNLLLVIDSLGVFGKICVLFLIVILAIWVVRTTEAKNK